MQSIRWKGFGKGPTGSAEKSLAGHANRVIQTKKMPVSKTGIWVHPDRDGGSELVVSV